MSLNTIIRRASNLLGISSTDKNQSQHEDGDIVYCKNNVCVHTASCDRGDGSSVHHAGYMVVKCSVAPDSDKSLSLSWIPNERLKRNHEIIHSASTEKEHWSSTSLRLSIESKSQLKSLDEDLKTDQEDPKDSLATPIGRHEPKSTDNYLDMKISSSNTSGSTSGVYSSDETGDISPLKPDKLCEVSDKRYVSSSSDSSSDLERLGGLTDPLEDDDISVGSSTDLHSSPTYFSSRARDQWYDRSAESMAYCANLAFPDSPSGLSLCPTPIDGGSSPIRRAHKCGIFSVNLGVMKSLRLFFNDASKTCGQLVIASRESQYKILHFHHGGLDKLALIFEEWNFLVHPTTHESRTDLKQFSVCSPQIQETELDPEENQYEYLDAETWLSYFSEEGLIEDELSLRRAIFFGGIEPQLRVNVWPFLLYYYDSSTTFTQRQQIIAHKHLLYQQIDTARAALSGEEFNVFWKSVQCTVEKDVVRTDRSNPCFAGVDNPNVDKMKKILLNFAYHNPHIGYTQGMSDILAPILSEVRNETDVFWCFVGMMSKTIFVTSPRDRDMEKNLNYLRELMKMMTPHFFEYVSMHEDGMDLLFCHRWILLCFKREFKENEALAMWEACWSNYQTDYFHLFVVVAIVAVYGGEVLQQHMRPDETLLYFTSLALHMDGQLVLKKARGLLHQFRSKSSISCGLVGLCELCGPGMWDSGHAPTIVCTGPGKGASPCPVCQSVPSETLSSHEESHENPIEN